SGQSKAGSDGVHHRQKINSLEINIGGHAKFECETEDAPNVTFKWYKSSVEIRQSEKYRILSRPTSSSLEVVKPVKADSGEYTCKASNQHGTDSCTATLVVTGATVCLNTAFTGTAPLTVKWFKEEKEIVTGGMYFIKKDASSSSLQLQSVKPSDSSKYTCQVSNDAGMVESTVLLFVKGAFVLYSVQLPVDIHEMNVILTCLLLAMTFNIFSQSLRCL
uniref:Ig-like domain-containing protein n=1 Tax=Oryzias melastigma TaxID=30732 RepID=A0A3B3BZZ0_ORYME